MHELINTITPIYIDTEDKKLAIGVARDVIEDIAEGIFRVSWISNPEPSAGFPNRLGFLFCERGVKAPDFSYLVAMWDAMQQVEEQLGEFPWIAVDINFRVRSLLYEGGAAECEFDFLSEIQAPVSRLVVARIRPLAELTDDLAIADLEAALETVYEFDS